MQLRRRLYQLGLVIGLLLHVVGELLRQDMKVTQDAILSTFVYLLVHRHRATELAR
jgi:hypothetical protein